MTGAELLEQVLLDERRAKRSKFYLGTHRNWLERTDVPLCVSRNTLVQVKGLPRAAGPWMLDSGAFTELARHGRYTFTAREYAEQVDRIVCEVGNCRAVAPMDYMCEPSMLAKTGLTVAEHQRRTVRNFLDLRERLGSILFPVLQGWEPDDYLRCWEFYDQAGVNLECEPMVGLGSVCRRGSDHQIANIVWALDGLQLHGFGVRGSALKKLAPFLASADSMAWSYRGRRMPRLPGCTHRGKNEANCLRWALIWRQDRLHDINQLRLEGDLCAA